METKICNNCKEEKCLTEFYDRKTNKKDGKRSQCKLCDKVYFSQVKNGIKKVVPRKKEELEKEGFKKCSSCQKVKEVIKFSKCSSNKTGLQNKCKDCESIIRKERYKKNKEQESLRNKNYYLLNKEKTLEYSKNWFQENKVKVIEKRKIRRKSDPLLKFVHNLRSLISCSFYRALNGNYKKSKRTEEILGCTIIEFFNYIQSLFTEDMSLEKMGSEIHIDHIIPISSAKTEEDIIKLCHYTNLQPMWGTENMSKGKKLI